MIWVKRMDISELLKSKPYDCVETVIGKLCVFGVSLSDKENLKDRGITLETVN